METKYFIYKQSDYGAEGHVKYYSVCDGVTYVHYNNGDSNILGHYEISEKTHKSLKEIHVAEVVLL